MPKSAIINYILTKVFQFHEKIVYNQNKSEKGKYNIEIHILHKTNQHSCQNEKIKNKIK